MGDDEFREESTPDVGANSGVGEGGGLEGGILRPMVGRRKKLL